MVWSNPNIIERVPKMHFCIVNNGFAKGVELKVTLTPLIWQTIEIIAGLARVKGQAEKYC